MKQMNRVLSLLLCVIMLLTVVPAEVFASGGASVLSDGAAVSSVTVSEGNSKKLSLGTSAQSYRWEIYVPAAGVWAGVLGCSDSSMTVTNAMVKNAMDSSGSARIRCSYTVDGEERHSQEVSVAVDREANEAQDLISEEPVRLRSAGPVARMMAEEPPVEDGVRYTISINYFYEDGSIAYNPYTAIVPEGTDFYYEAENPSIAGFTAYHEGEACKVIEIDIEQISADKTYTVVYKASETTYKVEHSYEKVGGGYEVETETRKAMTGSIAPDDLANVKTGFYVLPYVRSTIQADGSTVIKITYNRNYYLLTYDIEDGYGTDSIYAQYGAPIPTPDNPNRAGYVFTGWSPESPSKMPPQNTTCVAQWKTANTKYTIVYWHENADDDGYTQYHTVEQSAYTGQVVDGPSAALKGTAHTEHRTHFTFYQADQDVTIEGDGLTVVNVYYKRKVYTTTFNLGTTSGYTMTINGKSYQSGSNKEKYQIVAKYGAQIGHLWPLAENFTVASGKNPFYRWKYADGYYWVTKQYYMTDSNLLNKTLTANYGKISEIIVYYMLESFDQTSPAGGSFETGDYRYYYDGIYFDMSPLYSQKVSSSLDAWSTQKPLPGFQIYGKFEEIKSSSGLDYVRMYYLRNKHTLYLYSGKDKLPEIKNVMNEQPISGLSAMSGYLGNNKPPYPSDLEKNAYEFAGWYSTAEYHPGTEVDLNTFTMPDDDAYLYAKWVPVTRTVKTYATKEEAMKPDGTPLGTYTTLHNTKVAEKIPNPVRGNDFFVGWFYLKEVEQGGQTTLVETGFDFNSMPVVSDMKAYAKWSVNAVKPYAVRYQLADGTPVAEETRGEESLGTVLNFIPKGGANVYEPYREGYYPDRKSASITIGAEDADNIITFVYTKAEDPIVPYTVRYMDKETQTPLRPDKYVPGNKIAVLTEKFEPVPGYIPDAYQKDIVVIPDHENVLTFWYERDEENIRYRISHYVQDTEGDAFTREYTYTEAAARIDTVLGVHPITIPGFTYDPTVAGTTTEATVTAEGAHLKMYYTRNAYPYEIRYLEQGTNKPLQQTQMSTARYHRVLNVSAPAIDGYTLVSEASQGMIIEIEDGATAQKNIITFYYTENEVEIQYVVIGPEGCGSVTPESETLPVLTGSAQGSAAKVSGKTYRFIGWYQDEACTEPVAEDQITGDTVIPVKNSTTGQYEAATYYAKFEYNIADLIISTSGINGFDDDGAAMVFHVSGEEVDLNVLVRANSSVTVKDLVSGTYTVSLVKAYWRYEVNGAQAQEVTLSGQDVEVPFDFTREEHQWLDSVTVKKNSFGS